MVGREGEGGRGVVPPASDASGGGVAGRAGSAAVCGGKVSAGSEAGEREGGDKQPMSAWQQRSGLRQPMVPQGTSPELTHAILGLRRGEGEEEDEEDEEDGEEEEEEEEERRRRVGVVPGAVPPDMGAFATRRRPWRVRQRICRPC